MKMDWKRIIEEWVDKTPKIKAHKKEFILFFDKIIKLAKYPKKSFFGTNKNTISVMTGHLYLGVYIHSGNDKGIGMIVEKDSFNIKGVICKPVKSTLAKTSPHKLFWLWIPEVQNIKDILDNNEIWTSFQKASELVFETPQGKIIRKKEQEGKIALIDLLKQTKTIFEEEYNQNLETEILNAKQLLKNKRIKKLKELPEIPEKILINTRGFKRNPYVIIEVLERSQGICELCENKAPFIKIKDDLPFLEVHHIEPLANGGKDTIENTVGLCPNCHREAHLGVNRDKIKRKLNSIHNK